MLEKDHFTASMEERDDYSDPSPIPMYTRHVNVVLR